MVRKDQVDATGVNIQGFPEVFDGHDGTFDVPARAPGPDRPIPERLPFLRSFPEGEIARIGFLVGVHVNARAGDIAAKIVMRELSVPRETGNPKVHGAIADIGVVAGTEFL